MKRSYDPSPLIERQRRLNGDDRGESGTCYSSTCIKCGFVWISAVRPIVQNTFVRQRRPWFVAGLRDGEHIWRMRRMVAYRCHDEQACDQRQKESG